MVSSGMMPIPISGNKKIHMSTIFANIIISIISAECGYQILVTKTVNGRRISYILTNFTKNISALNSKYLTYY